MQVVATTGAIRHAKLQSNCYHQQTNTQLFIGQLTVSLNGMVLLSVINVTVYCLRRWV